VHQLNRYLCFRSPSPQDTMLKEFTSAASASHLACTCSRTEPPGITWADRPVGCSAQHCSTYPVAQAPLTMCQVRGTNTVQAARPHLAKRFNLRNQLPPASSTAPHTWSQCTRGQLNTGGETPLQGTCSPSWAHTHVCMHGLMRWCLPGSNTVCDTHGSRAVWDLPSTPSVAARGRHMHATCARTLLAAATRSSPPWGLRTVNP
jgi:hypothetical protein